MTKEVVFTNGGLTRGLHFSVDKRSSVRWQVVPQGETGTSKAFQSPQQVDQFMENYARRLGYPERSRMPRVVMFLSAVSRRLHSASSFFERVRV